MSLGMQLARWIGRSEDDVKPGGKAAISSAFGTIALASRSERAIHLSVR